MMQEFPAATIMSTNNTVDEAKKEGNAQCILLHSHTVKNKSEKCWNSMIVRSFVHVVGWLHLYTMLEHLYTGVMLEHLYTGVKKTQNVLSRIDFLKINPFCR